MANKAINSLTYGSDTYVFTLPYGTCSVAAGTAAKTVTVANSKFSLESGAKVTVKFTYDNTVASPTLNVNSTGPKAIYWHGAALPASQYWKAGAVLDFVYNGTQWDLIGVADISKLETLVGDTPVATQISNAIANKSDTGHKHAAGDITSGTLAVGRGGTGVTSNPSMLTNLGSTSAASVFAASPRPGVTGTLPIANGGTGSTTAAGALTNLGLSALTTSEIETICDFEGDSANVIPVATNTTIGCVAVGRGLAVDESGVVSLDVPAATRSTKGCVIVGDGLAVDGSGVLSNAGIQMKLLWQNANPINAFPAQSITVNGLENYGQFAIEWNLVETNDYREIQLFKTGYGGTLIGCNYFAADDLYYIQTKGFTFTTPNILNFDNSYAISTYQGGVSSNNQRLIPIAIYGIKGVQ